MTDAALVPASDGQLTSSQILAGLHTVKAVLAPDLTGDELKLFAMVAARSGLDPFAKQIYAIKRKGRVTFQTGIDGYRSIAVRTGLFDGQDEPEYGATCACGDKRPDGHPESATVRVWRKGVSRPIAATAYWHEYKPEAGQSGLGDQMWVRMPRVMIAKVAEALALRKAFPYDPERREGIGADLYTADEMAQAGKADAAAPAAAAPTAAARLAQRRAAVEAPKAEPVAEAAPAVESEAAEPDLFAPADVVEGEVVEADESRLAEVLRSKAETSGMVGPITLPQKTELQRILRPLGAHLALAGVRVAFGLAELRDLSAAQAQAIVACAVDDTFPELWAEMSKLAEVPA